MQEHALSWVPIVYSSGPVGGWDPFLPNSHDASHAADVSHHIAALRQQISDAHHVGKDLDILFFNAHSGHDSFSFSKAMQYFDDALDLEVRPFSPLVLGS